MAKVGNWRDEEKMQRGCSPHDYLGAFEALEMAENYKHKTSPFVHFSASRAKRQR